MIPMIRMGERNGRTEEGERKSAGGRTWWQETATVFLSNNKFVSVSPSRVVFEHSIEDDQDFAHASS